MDQQQLAQVFDSGDRDRIYLAVYRYTLHSLDRYTDWNYAEGHEEPHDMAIALAGKLLGKVDEGEFVGDGKNFVSFVNVAVRNRRNDFYDAANNARKTAVPLFETRPRYGGEHQKIVNPAVDHAMSNRTASDHRTCTRFATVRPGFNMGATPGGSSYKGIDILSAMCEDIRRGTSARGAQHHSQRRAMPALSDTDQAIVNALLDDEKRTYADVAAKVGMTAKQVENRLNTIRRRERKKREQALGASITPSPKIILPLAGIARSQTFL